MSKHLAGVDWFSIRKAFALQADTAARLRDRTEEDIATVAREFAQKALVGFSETVEKVLFDQILDPQISTIAVWEWDEKKFDARTAWTIMRMIEDKLREEGLSPMRGFTEKGSTGVTLKITQLKEKLGV